MCVCLFTCVYIYICMYETTCNSSRSASLDPLFEFHSHQLPRCRNAAMDFPELLQGVPAAETMRDLQLQAQWNSKISQWSVIYYAYHILLVTSISAKNHIDTVENCREESARESGRWACVSSVGVIWCSIQDISSYTSQVGSISHAVICNSAWNWDVTDLF